VQRDENGKIQSEQEFMGLCEKERAPILIDFSSVKIEEHCSLLFGVIVLLVELMPPS
jgi:hypothetical protein